MALSEDVKSKWYHALFEEDCMAVMEQLAAYPGLLKEGWESEPSRQVEGRKRREGTGWTKSTWKGRTALHVGASRGCAKLVMQVIGLCNLEVFDAVDEVYQRSFKSLEYFSFSNLVSNSLYSCNKCSRSLREKNRWNSAVKPDYHLCPDCYEKEGNEKDFIKIECGWRKPPVKAANISSTGTSDREATDGTPGQSPESSPQDAIEQRDPQRGREHAQAADKSVSVSLSAAAIKPQTAVSTIGRKNRLESSVVYNKDTMRSLLTVQDGESCGLNVIATAALYGNQVVDCLLKYANDVCAGPWDNLENVESVTCNVLAEALNANTNERKLLRRTIVEGMGEDIQTKIFHLHYDTHKDFNFLKHIREIFNLYSTHRDFNFLPPEEYLFHFVVAATEGRNRDLVLTCLWRAVRSSTARSGDELWRFLLEYRDGQGRTPFQVAIEYDEVDLLVKIIKDPSSTTDEVDLSTTETGNEREVVCAMTTCDAVGRTPIYRAAARGLDFTVETLLQYAREYEKVEDTCFAYWKTQYNLSLLYTNFDLESVTDFFPLEDQLAHTPVHAAMIHGNFDCAKLFINNWPEYKWDTMTFSYTDEFKLFEYIFRNENIEPAVHYNRKNWVEWDIVEFACLAGAPVQFVGFLLDILKYDITKKQSTNLDDLYYQNGTEEVTFKHLWHPVHIVASLGRYDMLKYLIHDLKCSPFLEDYDGNSALHHAMKVTELELKTHLMDYVHTEHMSLAKDKASRRGTKQVPDAKSIAERQGCINLLMQAGCDIFNPNDRNQPPYPTGSVKDAKFLFWWNEKQEKGFNSAQNNLNFATNAIAVTATLVATASYVGPLQPPMGYDANQIQYENVWVSIFIVCNTLSFYLAIVAITIALTPALPMPQQAMLEELQRTRGMVILAVGVLLPSIFFVFVAFASSSISVMSANITSEIGGIFTIFSTLVGMILCLLAFALFSIRLLAFIYPQEDSIRKIYDFSNHLLHRKAHIKKRRMRIEPLRPSGYWSRVCKVLSLWRCLEQGPPKSESKEIAVEDGN